jgi:hypothetical protein
MMQADLHSVLMNCIATSDTWGNLNHAPASKLAAGFKAGKAALVS